MVLNKDMEYVNFITVDLPGSEPIDTALYIFDSRGKFVTCTENRDTKGVSKKTQISIKCTSL